MVEFGIEPLIIAQPAIETLIPAQWLHTGDQGIDPNPNWMLYHQFAQRDALMVVMAREFDVPVGYLAAFLYPHPNAMSVKIASIPTYYVAERPTRALILARMVDYTIERLLERGIFKVDIETNADFSAGRLWELKGFKLKKLGYSLQLERPAGERYA